MTGQGKIGGVRAAAVWLLLLSLAVAISMLGGCKVKDTLRFDHAVHDSYAEGVECSQCHGLDGGKRLSPTHANCTDCHDIDEGTPSESCLACHTKKEPAPAKKEVRRSYADVIFSHAVHEDVECSTCHRTAKKGGGMTVPEMSDCFSCHTRERNRGDCAACHTEIRKNARPKNHTGLFVKTHGNMSERGRCEICHGADSCDQCHHTKKPASHSAGWKKDSHGKIAVRDRRRCTVCHEGSYCERCHGEKPYTHMGVNWKFGHGKAASKNRRSCLACHDQSLCIKCHKGKDFFRYQ